ncbi:MAG TPA: alpha/beta hydrolase [Pseudonocardia sp.]|nr:alpha/beta hydrolase [Pseudonocardia sp.]
MADLVTSDGVRLAVEVAGPARAPVTVVLVHGWTLDARTWGPVAAALAGEVRVVRYDHRGHGRSDAVRAECMTLERLADDLAEVVAAAAPDGPLVLAGHSMGGMAVMALAERHPGLLARRVAAVALVATASGGLAAANLGLPPRRAELVRRLEKRVHASPRWLARERLGDPRLLGPALRWLLLGPRPTREAVRLTTLSVASCRPATMAGFRPTLDAHERDAALAAFAGIPTVVLAGGRDRLIPVSAARRIARALPSANLTILPDTGHMIPVERPAAVAGRIAALVRAAAAGSPTAR